MAELTTRRVLITSFLVDLMDIVINVTVAIITGSTVMLVEAIAGFADLCSVFLLLIGNKRSQRRANIRHPFGFGKEQYFWATLAGFIILIISANLSFVFGWHAFKNPDAVAYIGLTYVVLLFSICTNGFAFLQSAKKLLQGRPLRRLPKVFVESWQTAPKTTLVLDAMGTTAAIVGLIALVAYQLTGQQKLDGLGAMAMAVTLGFFAVLLLIGVRSLIVGQSAPSAMKNRMKQAALEVPGVVAVVNLQTMILGSESILANFDINFKDDLTTDDIEKIVAEIKLAIQQALPDQVIQVSVESTSFPSKHS